MNTAQTAVGAAPPPSQYDSSKVPAQKIVQVELGNDFLKKARHARETGKFRNETYTPVKHCFVAQAARFTDFGEFAGTTLDFASCGNSEIFAKVGPEPIGADLRKMIRFVGNTPEDQSKLQSITRAFDGSRWTELATILPCVIVLKWDGAAPNSGVY